MKTYINIYRTYTLPEPIASHYSLYVADKLCALGIPKVKNRELGSIDNANYWLINGCWCDKFVIRYVTDVLRTHSSSV